jgi:hypothetical protein
MKDRLDELLTQHYARHDERDDAAERVLARLGTLPRQKRPSWARLPNILLDWQFRPAWPRMAALAACALIGFALGEAGLDRLMRPPAQDFAAVVFEPEPLTGLRP